MILFIEEEDLLQNLLQKYYKECVPYTTGACRIAASILGLTYVEAGDWGSTRGCYAYRKTNANYGGKVYFDLGGTRDEDKSPLVHTYKFRPSGHDCIGNFH